MIPLLLVALGGGAAALTHVALTEAATDRRRVLLLTVSTCGILGVVIAAAPPQWIVGVVCFGFLGGLAPMSSVALCTVTQIRDGRVRDAALFLAANVVGGVACVMFGILLLKSGVTLYSKF
ncbi:hypothetical protein HQ346_10670 [Rhodococcus sp. BP-252]|uniref:Fluoride-specific ion channel n=1 Tax=Rhodococcoides kyotonense TaxID=398843 RepID=A0A177YGZ9_9NOCA|nr:MULTISPECIES: CrcB family protein [Rhodococcus]MBY6412250.1 hypothetical protein [Rhodococcus sp. BP-320]MBY6416830.1 hypothetical protein [Rhodococcus sp. BP-321]MBY6421632.1 hypothetical protein [Rhodococcus sp. BP-324]MBY6426898.1 hypothetical protein [Rhodococcus sp. BP-323]MBY6432064.1 hypothetical protein [Rhodococcus sp. BP-322]